MAVGHAVAKRRGFTKMSRTYFLEGDETYFSEISVAGCTVVISSVAQTFRLQL